MDNTNTSPGILERLTDKIEQLERRINTLEHANECSSRPYSYTVEMVAEILTGHSYGHPKSISKATIMRWVERGYLTRIPAQICSTPLITRASVERFIDSFAPDIF